MQQEQHNYIMPAIVMAFSAFVLTSLIVIPAIEEVQADKGGIPNTHAGSHGRGHVKS
jgi:hypothetical protein